MKKFLTIVGLLLISFNLVYANPFNQKVANIILDAGHGGSDPGAVATLNNTTLLEKDINLEITLKVKELLEKELDCPIILTRDDDSFVTLATRAATATQNNPTFDKANILISIHTNSSTTNEASGFEIIVKEQKKKISFLDSNVPNWTIFRYANYSITQLNSFLNEQNYLLATYLLESLEKHFPFERSRGIKEQDLWVLNGSKSPAVLIEVGFISNSGDFEKLANSKYREQMAKAISEAIVNYVNRY